MLDDEAWERCWDGFKRSAWRMETQQTYTMPDERTDLAMFLAGEPEPSGHNDEWHNEIRAWVAEGKSVSRVRWVRRPLTDYQRYINSWGVPGNVAAGEKVRVLDVTDGDFGIPQQDFWIFDDTVVFHLNFNPDGTLRNHELIDNPDLAMYREWQERALEHSVSFDEWDAKP